MIESHNYGSVNSTDEALYSIAISLKRIADYLEKPKDIQSNNTDQPQTPHKTFSMMYENYIPKEHPSRDDLK